jgi:hypothetical protein
MKLRSLFFGLALLAALSGCGYSNRDISGTWVFKDFRYYDTAPDERMDPYELDQLKDLYRDMTYRFSPDSKFSLITPNLNSDTLKGTYSFEDDELVLKFAKDQKRYKIKNLKERELVLEEMSNMKAEDKVEFVYSR